MLYGEDVYVGYRYYDYIGRPALFPFVLSLSFTTFSLTDLKTTQKDEIINVAIFAENTGKRSGAEVSQIYIPQNKAGIMRPVKEFKGFKEVFFEPAEKKVVELEMELKCAASL